MTFDAIEKKIMRPPAAHNVARLLDPDSEEKTTENIARFAMSIPSFNYVTAIKMCSDRVSLGLSMDTALKAVKTKGAPSGRDQNEKLVRAFYEYDEIRGYSKLRSIDSYQGQFRISRQIAVPTAPTFTLIENGMQVPIVMCGWKSLPLKAKQLSAWVTMLESGLFSFADYRNSPWEILLFPEVKCDDVFARLPKIIRRGEIALFSEADMRELAAMYARAQQAAMPIARDIWEKRERSRREGPFPHEKEPLENVWDDQLKLL